MVAYYPSWQAGIHRIHNATMLKTVYLSYILKNPALVVVGLWHMDCYCQSMIIQGKRNSFWKGGRMIPDTTKRVGMHTAECINKQIRNKTEKNIACAMAGGPKTIDRRLADLDREWDLDRLLEMNTGVLCILGVVLGATVNRKFYLLPLIVGGGLIQHAIIGWCPTMQIWRRLGFRTPSEIEGERYALKALRGDFREFPKNGPLTFGEAMKATSR